MVSTDSPQGSVQQHAHKSTVENGSSNTAEQSPPAQETTTNTKMIRAKPTSVILLLGSPVLDKTAFFYAAGGSHSTKYKGSSSHITTSHFTFSDQAFNLVDTPSFDSLAIPNDLDAFTKIADHLRDRDNINLGVTGVVYIHLADDPLESRTLVRNLDVLFELFLGPSGLPRLTILIATTDSMTPNVASRIHAMPAAHPFYKATASGARIEPFHLGKSSIHPILVSYASKAPVLLSIQQDRVDNHQIALRARIEERLGYFNGGSLQLRLDEQAKPYANKIQYLEGMLAESQSNNRDLSEKYAQINQRIVQSQEEATRLRQQLQQTEKEYGSLRSQLQIQENIEQSDVVQSLKDLNRHIDDTSRSISAHLVDTHIQRAFAKNHADVTALNAKRLPKLKELFGHVEGDSSLICSSAGEGMPVEDFFDYAIRSLLCKHLCQKIFHPFHPGVSSSQSKVIATMYEDVQRQEPQAVAAKWRATCFKSIYKPDSPNITPHLIKTIAQKIQQYITVQLISSFFGQSADIKLTSQHFDDLERLIQSAWEWNSVLKGEVIILGDFSLSTYVPAAPFDPDLMSDFESSSQNPQPRRIFGTLGLGLLSHRAIGGGCIPEMTVVSKAIVATQSLYT